MEKMNLVLVYGGPVLLFVGVSLLGVRPSILATMMAAYMAHILNGVDVIHPSNSLQETFAVTLEAYCYLAAICMVLDLGMMYYMKIQEERQLAREVRARMMTNELLERQMRSRHQ